MPVNDQDVRALTYLAKRVRDDTHGCGRWDEAGIAAKVAELKGQELAQAVERVIRHAADREAKTPGAILRPFTPAAAGTVPHITRTAADYCADCEQPLDDHRATDHEPRRKVRHAIDAAARVQDIKQHIACEEPR